MKQRNFCSKLFKKEKEILTQLIMNFYLLSYMYSESLSTILSYLSDHWQHIKIDSSFSSWSKLTQGVPQGSVLGPLLFIIYLNNLVFALKDIELCNFVDDTTLCVCDLDLNTSLNKLKENSAIALTWFETNYMKIE